MITYDDFAKLEIKIGKIIACEKVENADKLLKLTVDFGEKQLDENEKIEDPEPRQDDNKTMTGENDHEIRTIVSGIAEWYKPEDLVGLLCPFLTNLEPRKLRGIESQGMILAADPGNNSAVLLHPDQIIPQGSKVR